MGFGVWHGGNLYHQQRDVGCPVLSESYARSVALTLPKAFARSVDSLIVRDDNRKSSLTCSAEIYGIYSQCGIRPPADIAGGTLADGTKIQHGKQWLPTQYVPKILEGTGEDLLRPSMTRSHATSYIVRLPPEKQDEALGYMHRMDSNRLCADEGMEDFTEAMCQYFHGYGLTIKADIRAGNLLDGTLIDGSSPSIKSFDPKTILRSSVPFIPKEWHVPEVPGPRAFGASSARPDDARRPIISFARARRHLEVLPFEMRPAAAHIVSNIFASSAWFDVSREDRTHAIFDFFRQFDITPTPDVRFGFLLERMPVVSPQARPSQAMPEKRKRETEDVELNAKRPVSSSNREVANLRKAFAKATSIKEVLAIYGASDYAKCAPSREAGFRSLFNDAVNARDGLQVKEHLRKLRINEAKMARATESLPKLRQELKILRELLLHGNSERIDESIDRVKKLLDDCLPIVQKTTLAQEVAREFNARYSMRQVTPLQKSPHSVETIRAALRLPTILNESEA